jgi:uncharacterized membrane protein
LSSSNPRHRNIRAEVKDKLSWTDKLAIIITNKVGTMGFFGIILAWTIIWLSWNMFAPTKLQFDPFPGFVLWLFISNMIQILLMPLIMVGQNVQGRHSEARAENDLAINIKAETEIQTILHHLETQNNLLINLVNKIDKKL